ncbi:MAG: hypothetical protein GY749_35350, partial [Desulfobacteraceae bacterium]|nr:hypothetical protein [Desulfobacteraceae bacterium]
MKEEYKACFVSVTYKASFELLFHALFVTFMSWLFYMKEEYKVRFVSVSYQASFELLFHALFVTFMSWLFY